MEGVNLQVRLAPGKTNPRLARLISPHLHNQHADTLLTKEPPQSCTVLGFLLWWLRVILKLLILAESLLPCYTTDGKRAMIMKLNTILGLNRTWGSANIKKLQHLALTKQEEAQV